MKEREPEVGGYNAVADKLAAFLTRSGFSGEGLFEGETEKGGRKYAVLASSSRSSGIIIKIIGDSFDLGFDEFWEVTASPGVRPTDMYLYHERVDYRSNPTHVTWGDFLIGSPEVRSWPQKDGIEKQAEVFSSFEELLQDLPPARRLRSVAARIANRAS